MREIKFRGFDNETWVYGYLLYVESFDYYQILDDSEFCNIVDGDSVGQYTEFKGRDRSEIYEGDIVEVEFDDGTVLFEVKMSRGCWVIETMGQRLKDHMILSLDSIFDKCKIVGTVFEEKVK